MAGITERAIEDFILTHTVVETLSLIPELQLYQATTLVPLWQGVESFLGKKNPPPPYWAFSWAGGQAIGRFLLDQPQWIKGKSLLDFAAGGGVTALAALKAGAAEVFASEIDPMATVMQQMNAKLNALNLHCLLEDVLVTGGPAVDVIAAGDVCYEKPMAECVLSWLRHQAQQGVTVLLGDPGRAYAPQDNLELLAQYDVPTTLELENQPIRKTLVYRLIG